jgi:Nucleotide-diphospho-sugar transferase
MHRFFTICSNNYLSQALSLRASLLEHYSDCELTIVLADKNTQGVSNCIPIEDIIDSNLLGQLVDEYNIIEFNTAIKPYAFRYFFQQGIDKVFYIDPDILFFDNIDPILDSLDRYTFALTPHITKLIEDKSIYQLLLGTINTGSFNLGFLGLKKNEESISFVNWWCSHMTKYGHNNILNGQFYDQKLFNLIPAISASYKVIDDFGCNVAEWNLHERTITKEDENYLVNGKPLKFFHYSNVRITNTQDNTDSNPLLRKAHSLALIELIDLYISQNHRHGYEKYKAIIPYYKFAPNIHRTSRLAMYFYKLYKLWRGKR